MNTRGVWAELRAAAWLRRRGYRVLHVRWRGGGGEIDLVAREGDTLVFVEVKSAPRLGDGARRVGRQKQELLRRAARAYLRQAEPGAAYRFDVLEDSDAGFRLIRGAF